MSWSNGYFTDLAYTHGYYPELNPATLRLACLCHGVEALAGQAPTYLELGFGQGVSINIHAAGSEGAYWGTDFNPAQTAAARRLAAASGADVRLFDDSFAELAGRTDLPDFDVIALHGIWSWVSDANRTVIKEILRRKLKPGGIVYVSYNCLPGWAPIIPIRQLMSLYGQHGGGGMSGPFAMIDGTVNFARDVATAGSLYFRDNPLAGHHLDRMAKQDRNYLAHEYLNADWHLENFFDMARSLDDAKLTFLGSARVLDGLDTIQLDEDGRNLVARFDHPLMRETIRDHLVNRRFRADIFVKGARKLTGPERREAWLAQAFVLTKPSIDIPKRIQCARGEVELPADRYDPVIEALSDEACQTRTVADLLQHPKLFGRDHRDLIDVLTVLFGAGLAAPAQEGSERVSQRCAALNDYVLSNARSSVDVQHLVSPITGGGVMVPHLTQLFILAFREGTSDAAALADYVWRFLDGLGERLVRNGNRIETRDETLRELEGAATKFVRFDQPHLKSLEIY